MLGRLALYWIMSTAMCGTVAALARFPTYSGTHGTFWETFGLYTFPLPMALGMFHLPALALGSMVCVALRSGTVRRLLSAGAGLVVASHILAHIAYPRDHWGILAFATGDILVLWLMSRFIAAPVPTK